jgi:hypothetical protein
MFLKAAAFFAPNAVARHLEREAIISGVPADRARANADDAVRGLVNANHAIAGGLGEAGARYMARTGNWVGARRVDSGTDPNL